MTLLVGTGVFVAGVLAAGAAFYLLWRFWPFFALLGFAASLVGIAGGIGHAVMEGGSHDPPAWIFACAVGGLVLAFFSILISDEGA